MIPKDKIEEVRDRAGIVEVVSEYVPLTKRGANHIGLCPFHSEKTPSFSVNEEKKIYYCFGCHATGSVITFLMNKEGMSFPDAVESLARRYGVVIKQEKGMAQQGAISGRERIFEALKAGQDYFKEALKSNAGGKAREYLKTRGYAGRILDDFGVGFAPDGWEGCASALKRKNIEPEWAVKAGLIIKKDKGYYDRFRARIMFPISDGRGRIIGFGGRGLGDAEPKYLNSPESEVFKKGAVLYGLHQAKAAIAAKGEAIVVEGYFDLLAMHKNGFDNSVATMGTALTVDHLRLLKGNTVYLLFDSDEAGRRAALRSLDLSLEEQAVCRAVLLPSGKDPDEFVSSSGAVAMKTALDTAGPLMDFFLNELERACDLTQAVGKGRYLNEAMGRLSKMSNIAEKGHYVGMIAGTLGLPVDAVYTAMKTGKAPQDKTATGVVSPAPGAKKRSVNLKEMTILRILLKHPEYYTERACLAIDRFEDQAMKEIGMIIADALKEGRSLNVASLIDALGAHPAASGMAELLMKDEEGFIEDAAKMLEDSLNSVLNRGELKQTTLEKLKWLEEMGRLDMVQEIRRRVEGVDKPKKP
ncbi:MAG: DNA primase [Deltaproteobacteria bacterium]|nr:DNA primase [Deltaproteobacteria bacterium]